MSTALSERFRLEGGAEFLDALPLSPVCILVMNSWFSANMSIEWKGRSQWFTRESGRRNSACGELWHEKTLRLLSKRYTLRLSPAKPVNIIELGFIK